MDNKESIRVWGNIYVTNNYELFKKIKGNRKPSVRNIKKLEKSMREEQLVIPICVNNKYEIIDGQHRYHVCKDLGLPVYYYIVSEYGTQHMKRANLVSSNWTGNDYLNLFVDNGDEEYIYIKNIETESGVKISDLLKLISKFSNQPINKISFDFKEGLLCIDEEIKKKIEDFITCLNDFNFFEEFKSKSFISAFMDLYMYENYDHNVMKQKLESRKQTLKKQNGKEGYLATLTQEIYSFRGVNKIYYNPCQKQFYIL